QPAGALVVRILLRRTAVVLAAALQLVAAAPDRLRDAGDVPGRAHVAEYFHRVAREDSDPALRRNAALHEREAVFPRADRRRIGRLGVLFIDGDHAERDGGAVSAD